VKSDHEAKATDEAKAKTVVKKHTQTVAKDVTTEERQAAEALANLPKAVHPACDRTLESQAPPPPVVCVECVCVCVCVCACA